MDDAASCPAGLRQDDSTLTGRTSIDRLLSPSGRIQRNDVLGRPPGSTIWSCIAIANSVSASPASGLVTPPEALLAAAKAPSRERPKSHLAINEVRRADHLADRWVSGLGYNEREHSRRTRRTTVGGMQVRSGAGNC